uniref:Uncharacterized protein n=1 Tax=Ditylum brightwellii TaxID=49249 RepID=A0A7S4VP04_9STRA
MSADAEVTAEESATVAVEVEVRANDYDANDNVNEAQESPPEVDDDPESAMSNSKQTFCLTKVWCFARKVLAFSLAFLSSHVVLMEASWLLMNLCSDVSAIFGGGSCSLWYCEFFVVFLFSIVCSLYLEMCDEGTSIRFREEVETSEKEKSERNSSNGAKEAFFLSLEEANTSFRKNQLHEGAGNRVRRNWGKAAKFSLEKDPQPNTANQQNEEIIQKSCRASDSNFMQHRRERVIMDSTVMTRGWILPRASGKPAKTNATNSVCSDAPPSSDHSKSLSEEEEEQEEEELEVVEEDHLEDGTGGRIGADLRGGRRRTRNRRKRAARRRGRRTFNQRLQERGYGSMMD